MRGAPAAAPGSWTRQVEDLVRALSGAFLFAIPLLFTMEMWWLGEHTATWKLLLVLGIALAANYALARATGFKARQLSGGGPGRPGEHLEQAVSALAVGILAAGIVLVALNRIELDDPLDTILGKIVMQTLPLSLGASVANAVFARGASRAGDDSGGADSGGGRDHGDRGGHDRDGSRTRGPARGKPAPHWQEVLSDIGATATGGIFLGFSVAPTDEIPMLAAGLDLRHQLAVVLLTLAVTYAIVFASGFDPEQVRGRPKGPFQSPLTETLLAYFVSLAISLGAVFLFGHVAPGDPLGSIATQVVVLAVPTAIGGAAGRLVL